MNTYMLLLHDYISADMEELSAEEIQNIISEYVNWSNQLEADGRLVGGEKLADEGGKHIKMVDDEIRITDGPFTEVKEILGGYFLSLIHI